MAIKVHNINEILELFQNFDFDDEPFHDASPDVSGQPMYWDGFGSPEFVVFWFLVIRREEFCSFTWFIYV